MLACFIVPPHLWLLGFGDSEVEYTFVRLVGFDVTTERSN